MASLTFTGASCMKISLASVISKPVSVVRIPGGTRTTTHVTVGLVVEGENYDYQGGEPPIEILTPDEAVLQRIWLHIIRETGVIIEDFSNALYFGYVQSGKTFVQYAILWYSCFILKKGAVHLLDNRTDSMLQNINRDYQEFRAKVYQICLEEQIPNPENYMFFYKPLTKRYLTASEKIGFSDSPHVVHAAINNPTQLKALLRLPIAKRQVLVRDESDVFVMKEDTKTMPLNEKLDTNAQNKYLFTATPFKNFNRIGNRFEHKERLPIKPEYRGYDEHIKHIIDPNESIVETLKKVFLDVKPSDYKSITLVHTDFTDKKHAETKQMILGAFPNQVHVMILNSRQSGLVRPVTSMMEHIAKTEDDKPWVIIAGQMAGRAISFRTLRSAEKQSHITAMVYNPAKSADQSTMIQAMRVFGNFHSDIPDIHVYWTKETDDDVRNSFWNVDSMVDSVQAGLLSRTCIEQAPIRPMKRPFASNLDDTKGTKNTLEDKEFDSLEEARLFCQILGTTKEEILTEEIETVTGLTPFSYGREKGIVRTELAHKLSQYQGTGSYHVAWNTKRYRELFCIRQRQVHEHYTHAQYTCGNPELQGSQVTMKCVLWKPDCENAKQWTDPNTLYLFQTTKETWKAWIPGRMKELAHIRHGDLTSSDEEED